MAKKSITPAPAQAAQAAPEISPQQIVRSLGLRLGLPLLAGWFVAFWFGHWVGFVVMGVLTVAAGAAVAWALSRMQKSQRVMGILKAAQTGDREGRKAAVEQLEASFKAGDVTAALAKAQIQMQDDPAAAQTTLEAVNLAKALPAEADQVRFQRAFIHLVRGETDRARPLADAIDLKRTEQAAARAAMAAVIAETWARTGQAKKAQSTLELFNADDPALGEGRLQMWRAWAFVAASTGDTKQMRRYLKKLANENPQLLSGFLVKKVHPLLEREAKQLLMQSGAMPRKVQYQRR